MSEYWKSQPRKYCEYCKCWITDNKPSVQFHEKGKNHQENVRRKIDEIRKKGTEDAKRKEELESDMQRMEKAALEAFKKDLAENPELAAKYGVVVRTKEEKEREKREKEAAQRLKEEEERIEREKNGVWYEAKSPQDYSYYWNTKTNESVWVAPEKYISLEEQEAKKEEEEKAKKEAEEKAKKEAEEKRQEENKELVESNEEEQMNPGLLEGPLPRVKQSAYGTWEKMKEADDLQLPTVEAEEEPAVPLAVEDIPLPTPPKEKKESGGRFKEKRVKTLAAANDTQIVTFKKRKIAQSARKVRQRDEDEDD